MHISNSVYVEVHLSAAYGGHFFFVELNDRWRNIAKERFDDDKTALVMGQAQFATSTICHFDRRLAHVHSQCRRVHAFSVSFLFHQRLYTSAQLHRESYNTHAVFSPPPVEEDKDHVISVCLYVCLPFSWLDHHYSYSYEWIWIKVCGPIDHDPRTD